MPPKVKVTKEKIVETATDIVRREGYSALCARRVAAELGCSTQPIFSNFESMSDLCRAVVESAEELLVEYMRRERERGEFPDYKASGIAYIRFAGEERELFKLLYMRDRSGDTVPLERETDAQMVRMVGENTGLEDDGARLFHLEMWVFVHGIASMIATGFFEPDIELVSRMMTDAYQGLKSRFERKTDIWKL